MFAANTIWEAREAERLTRLAAEYSSLAGQGVATDAGRKRRPSVGEGPGNCVCRKRCPGSGRISPASVADD